jgi:hypothetical protein
MYSLPLAVESFKVLKLKEALSLSSLALRNFLLLPND